MFYLGEVDSQLAVHTSLQATRRAHSRVDLPTYTVVTTSVCPLGVVAFTLMELSRTVMTGAVVSASTEVEVAHSEAAGRHTPSVEHLQHSRSQWSFAEVSRWLEALQRSAAVWHC